MEILAWHKTSFKFSINFGTSYHTESEGVDVIEVFDAILPGDEALDVDVDLITKPHDGLIVLLISENKTSHQYLFKRNLKQS